MYKYQLNRKNMHVFYRCFLALSLLFTVNVNAACDSADHRAFDFWVGDWNVKTPDGKAVGTNTISKLHGDCVLHEQYSTPKGFNGSSLNTYDAGRKVWHQTWTDNANSLLLLEGGLNEGNMVLEGETTSADSKTTSHRITWTPNEDGSVRQFWQVKGDSGKWETAFDGIYTKK